MRNYRAIEEVPLTYSKPSVITETRAHFDSLLRNAANQEDDSQKNRESSRGRLHSPKSSAPISKGTKETILQSQQSRRRKKHHSTSKQKLIDQDSEFLSSDDDTVTSTDEVYMQRTRSDEIIVHCNPEFVSDSDVKGSPVKQIEEYRKKSPAKSIGSLEKNSSTKSADLNSSTVNSPKSSNSNKQNLLLIAPRSTKQEEENKRREGLWLVSNAGESPDNTVVTVSEHSQPTPPPRSKKMSGRFLLSRKISKLSSQFSHSTFSSHVSSEESVQTAVHLSTENEMEKVESPITREENTEGGRQIQFGSSPQKPAEENIELKPLTGWTPSYEEIDESTLSSQVINAPLSSSKTKKPVNQKTQNENSIQSYDEIEEDSKAEANRDESQSTKHVDKEPTSKSAQSSRRRIERRESVSTSRFKQRRRDSQLSRITTGSVESNDDDVTDTAERFRYNYDQVLGVLVHQCDRLQVDSLVIHPVVRVHVIDISTGKYLQKSDPNRCQGPEEPNYINYLMPISTQPSRFLNVRSATPVWEETLIFNEDVRYFTADGMNVIILFEIIDFVSFEMACLQYKRLGSEGGWHRVAWAFLKPIASNGSSNLSKRLRLQLFKPAVDKRAKNTSHRCDVYQQWLRGSRSRYPATLHVTVQGVRPPSDLRAANTNLPQNEGSIDALTPSLGLPLGSQETSFVADVAGQKDMEGNVDQTDHKTEKPSEIVSWSRIPGQTCKIPNEKALTLLAGNIGCFCLRFSPCGKFLAASGANHNSHSLLVYGIPGGALVKRFQGHQGLIYDLQWSAGSKFILSASADCTACVWDVDSALMKMLPHPSFVYCASFFPGEEQALSVVTGCCDHILRFWSRTDKHDEYKLVQELGGHEGFITSMCYDEAGNLYSGDSEGHLRVWSCEESTCSLVRKINIKELNGTAISRLIPHPGGQRLLIHARDSILRMIHIPTGAPIQWFSGALNNRLQTGATLSPCGRLVLSASEDGSFWVWNADTGKQLAVYSNMIQRPSTQKSVLPLSGTVDYHPHEHMAAFSVYGKCAPIVVCVNTRNASGKGLGLQVMSGNNRDTSAPLSTNPVYEWMKSQKEQAEDSDQRRLKDISVGATRPVKASRSMYEGSLASIIQQMDEVIAMTRRSNDPADLSATKSITMSPSSRVQGLRNNFPPLTQVSEKGSSSSSNSSHSIRRNPHNVLQEQRKIKKRHFNFERRKLSQEEESRDLIAENNNNSTQYAVISEVAAVVSTAGIKETLVKGKDTYSPEKETLAASADSAPNKTNNRNEHVLSISSFNSDSDSHVVDLTEILA